MNPVKVFSVFLVSALIFLGHPNAFCCNVCHSKDPKMVRMHKELGYKDCFNCHTMEGKRSPEEQRKQMISDERCIRCHKK